MTETPDSLVTLEDICAALAEVPARVDIIVHLRSMVVDCSSDSVVEDLFGEMNDAELKELLPQLSVGEHDAVLNGDMDTLQVAVDERKIFGFIAKVSTPIVGKHGSHSWGAYTHKMFYADTFDGALRAGLAWATVAHEKRRTR